VVDDYTYEYRIDAILVRAMKKIDHAHVYAHVRFRYFDPSPSTTHPPTTNAAAMPTWLKFKAIALLVALSFDAKR